MTPEPPIPNTPPGVSILARVVPAFSYALPALGAAVSAFFFIRVMQGMRNAESAGIAAVAGGIYEANIAILISLYLAVFVGIVGIIVNFVRAVMATTTASPAGWLFLLLGVLGTAPMLALWLAESRLLDVFLGRYDAGVSAVAQEIAAWLYIAIGLAPFVCLILLAVSVIPLPGITKAKSKWSPVIFLALVEVVLIGMTVAYHLRTNYFYQGMMNERF